MELIDKYLPILGVIGIGYYVWVQWNSKPKAAPPPTFGIPKVNEQPVDVAEADNVKVEVPPKQARLMTFNELLNWSGEDSELFKRMFPLTLPKEIRDRYEKLNEPSK